MIPMNPEQYEHYRARMRCAFKGHEKTWNRGFLGPEWECTRCGRTGGLEDHSGLTGGEHLLHIAVAVAVVGAIYLILKAIF